MGTGYGLARQINKIYKKNKLFQEKILRLGPRFYITSVKKQGKELFFKIAMKTSSEDYIGNRSNAHLVREIIFLNFIHKKGSPFLKRSIPQLKDSGIKPRAWYLREYGKGTFQNVPESNFLFKSDFFNEKNAKWAAKFLNQVHEISHKFDAKKHKDTYLKHNLDSYEHMINWNKTNQILGKPNYLPKIKKWLNGKRKLFNANRNFLNHFEPYASHFLKTGDNSFQIIDWENVGWGNNAHDVSVLWLRAFKHPKWRKQLIKYFLAEPKNKKHFFDLFQIELLLQSYSNLPFIDNLSLPAEKRIQKPLMAFTKKVIRDIVDNKFEL